MNIVSIRTRTTPTSIIMREVGWGEPDFRGRAADLLERVTEFPGRAVELGKRMPEADGTA